MRVGVTVQLDDWDVWTLTPNEVADAILRALGGDETKDYVTSTVVPLAGTAGTPPTTPAATGEVP